MVLKITNLHILRHLSIYRLYLLECYTVDNQRCTHTDKESGLLSLLNSQSTDGELPIYITLSPKEYFVLTANYKGGSITVFSQDKKGKLQRDTKIIRFAGNGPNKKKAGTIASALRDLYT